MVLDTQENTNKEAVSNIASHLCLQATTFLEASTRDEAISQLIEQMDQTQKLTSKDLFLKAVLERETVASTGIGMGVAIPHAKLPIYDDFFIAVGILKNGVAWGSMDGLPVRLIFLIGGPDDKQTYYLKLLSQLTLYLRDEEKRKKLLTLTAPEHIIQLFQS